MTRTIPSFLAALIFFAATFANADDNAAKALAKQIGEAHQKTTLASKRAIQSDITLDFGGKRMLDAVLTFSTDGGRSRIEPKSGGVMVFDGKSAWVAPDTKNAGPPPRFHLLTWPYFALAATKLMDGGTIHSDAKSLKLNGQDYDTFKLTFAAGTGDAPKDWYVVYADPKTHVLKALGYIVTYGQSIEEAEKAPHAIVYDDYKTIDGVPIATTWSFYNWNAKDGLVGDPIGKATLSNIRFITPDDNTFAKPANATEDALPPSK